ncbi:MAG: FtsX-like permease family protein, partial [Acetivibrio sp.]
MIKVNNKKTIRKLAVSSFQANKLRNLFAVISIILTTILFTGLFTVAGSLLSSMEESTMRQVGSNFHGGFKYLTQEQYDKLKTHPDIKSISYSVVLGIAENKKLAKRPTEIRYANDEIEGAAMFSLPTTGRLPQKEDELATDTLVLEHLGIPAKLGQKVTLEYSVGDEKHTDTFTLVGFWQGDKLMSASQVWLARNYVEKQLANYIPTGNKDPIGKINAEVNFANSFRIESKLIQVILDSGYTPDEIAYGVNWAYTGNRGSADMGTILGSAMAILMIVLCGYLMISNVFAISVAKDIRFYGLLKTIGTTGRQIRFFIRRQAILLCIIGVPLGLFAGYFVGAFLTPLVLSILNTNVIKITANPLAFLLSGFFGVFTVGISIRKPSKMAAKVSPIEALHRTDGAQKSRKTSKKSGGIKLWSMAMRNVLRNKKKAVLVTVSLSLSLILLNCAYSMAN